MANGLLQLRIDDTLRKEASDVYSQLGLDLPTAIRMFLTRSVQVRGIPFSMILPEEDYKATAAVAAMKRMSSDAEKAGVADMTLEEINQLYGRLAEEYGLADLFSYVGEEWVAIPHTFQSPLYYFSYAASMIVAVELWILGQDNVNAAEGAYLTIQSRPEEARLRTLAQDCHLADPIDPGTIHEITSALQSWMNEHF